MTTPEALNALADRVEREEPSLELEAQIFDALGFKPFTKPFGNFLRSLDAAVTLVPEGYWYTVNSMKRGNGTAFVGPYDDPMGFRQKERAEASSTALALTAAALRARAADMQARAASSPPQAPKVRSPE